MEAEVIAVANPKGGCGKTTTSVNLSACVAFQKKKVLLVDLDPQAGATVGLGIKSGFFKFTVKDVLSGFIDDLREVICATKVKNLYIIPSSSSLVEVEVKLRRQKGGGLVLKSKLGPVLSEFDYIFIDTPPSLGVLTLNAITSASRIIIPVQTQFYALRGMSLLLNMVNIVREKIGPDLCKVRVLATMYDARTRISQIVLSELRKNFQREIFNTVIPVSTRLAEAPGFGLPVISYDPHCSGALAYKELAMEIVKDEKR